MEHALAQDDLSVAPKLSPKLPVPKGYKLLVALPSIEERTAGGIIKAKQTMDDEQISTVVGYVVALGPDAYNDSKKFPTGPYCKEGDWIVMRAYTGTRFKVDGQEFRLLNDDSVEAVVDDPRGITKL